MPRDTSSCGQQDGQVLWKGIWNVRSPWSHPVWRGLEGLCCPGQRLVVHLGFCFFSSDKEEPFGAEREQVWVRCWAKLPVRVVRLLRAEAGKQGWSLGAQTRSQGQAEAAEHTQRCCSIIPSPSGPGSERPRLCLGLGWPWSPRLGSCLCVTEHRLGVPCCSQASSLFPVMPANPRSCRAVN